MFKVEAQSKFKNPNIQSRLYFLIGVGVLITILGFFYYQSPWIAASILICFAALYIILSLPSIRLNLMITDDGLIVTKDTVLKFENCLGWVVVDLGDYFELVIQTLEIRQPFNYFYIAKDNQEFQNFLIGLAQVIPYEEDLSLRDRNHVILRRLGLK